MTEQTDISIRWMSSPELKTTYANHVSITHAGGEFYLTFGELIPSSPSEEAPTHVDVIPVARIAVAPEAMLRIAQAINANMQRYKQRLEEQVLEQENSR